MTLKRIVFVTLGGDTGKKEVDWEPGFQAIATISREPYDHGYSPENKKYFKFDIQIESLFQNPLKREDFICYPNAFDARYIGPELTRDPSQALSTLEYEKAVSVIRCVLDKTPSLLYNFQKIFSDSFIQDVLNAVRVFFPVDVKYQQSPLEAIKNNFNAKIDQQPIVSDYLNNHYRQYITAIKSKPFLLLAGISGTGKSRIVRELARACWDVGSPEYERHSPSNFEMIQVKPNWHDSSELIGYLSNLNGTKYIYGKFLEFVVKAWVGKEVPYFLCLDEMNLAPVEQYFAEYLSVIESRKNENGRVITDPIIAPDIYYSDNTIKKVYTQGKDPSWYLTLIRELLAKTNLSEENQTELVEQFKKEGITLPPNLIVVGTVNMDETTFSFSRKVLDRAMTIEMNEFDLYGGLTEKHENIGKLGKQELIADAVEGSDVYDSNKEICDKVLEYLKVINEKLENNPFKVAYRTRNEMLLYVINNLPYNKNEDGSVILQPIIIARALDEITNMKILSRIEGDETKVSNSFLNNLSSTIKTELNRISGKEYSG
ncbi:MAG: hypothetical protein J6Z11_06270, partial [Candidatus Riflebacteria bacterium]|nr:hypothetical protein [Candidatus Riflebacteria bacterium]